MVRMIFLGFAKGEAGQVIRRNKPAGSGLRDNTMGSHRPITLSPFPFVAHPALSQAYGTT